MSDDGGTWCHVKWSSFILIDSHVTDCSHYSCVAYGVTGQVYSSHSASDLSFLEFVRYTSFVTIIIIIVMSA